MATVFDSPVSPIPTIVDLPRPEFKYEPDAFPAAFAGDALVLGFLSDPTESLPVAVEALPDALKDAIRALIKAEKFNAAAGTSASARVLLGDSSPIARIALVGLAPPKKSESENEGVKSGETEESATEKKDESEGWSAAIKHAAGFARESKTCESVGVWLVANSSEDKACGWNKRNVELGVAAALASAYKDERFKGTLFQKDKEKKEKEQPGATASEDRTICITIGGAMDGGEAAFEEATARAMALEAGVTTTKQLVNAPPNVVNPVSLAETARKIAAGSDCLKVWVLEKDECEKRNMGAYLAVARGSEYPPKLIHIVYTPPDATEDVAPARTLAFVGKGLTFDSGGYNIKAGAGSMIELMKFDMGGAAAVLGAAQAIGALKPKGVQVHFVVAACENMVDANAYRPGDVLTASNGITIEIGNTDAEGRLTLADALVFAEEAAEKSAGENGVEFILDVATLTGAIVVSLGNDYAGLFPANQAAADKVLAAAKAGGEKMWHMPMPAEYAEQIKSKVADIRNVGGRGGGSITAALFLRNFVKPSTPWAHLDIAGTVWKEGPTGYGVRTLVALAENAS
eukprot:CAMPEP_0185832282 /NCGR_PEP_ID=MMETSP1353-20130828/1991_1 /TAXON_ID=1077150 /ORGANISM="Erythrolobus australicus, Strain CCMP3124" /LENGTH=573 /DNA_ID=CAMNT_0028530435 /DNA_START=326 /DNA_END=2047 /DNA_ORIENTATION=-